MKKFIYITLLLGFTVSGFAQITFNGCHLLFEDQNYVFNQISTDVTGRNVFITTPIDGGQECGGIGTCEFMMAWNDLDSVWEFIADDGNGDFSNPLVVYTNASPSIPNPPSLILGTWLENSVITEDNCQGNLSVSNAILTGDIQDTVLETVTFQTKNQISLYPNPVRNELHILNANSSLKFITIYNALGQLVLSSNNDKFIDVSNLLSGLYLVRLHTQGEEIIKKIVIE